MVGHSFLYVFEGKYIEVIYRAKDFMHLTGVDTNLSSDAYEVQYIFSKRNDEKLYNVLKYSDERYEISSLSQEILDKVDNSLLS